MIDSIDIFDDSMIFDLFALLDKNDDSFISKNDFIDLLESKFLLDFRKWNLIRK